jgi:hypothetical protein
MNVIKSNSLAEVSGRFSEQPTPFPTPAADPTPADPVHIIMYVFDIDHPPYKDPDTRLLITN